jgi:hypothetical protein
MKSNLVAERTLEKETATSTEKKESKNSSVVVSNDDGKETVKGKQACGCCRFGWGWGGGCGPRWGCGWRPAPIFWGGGCGGGCGGWFAPQVIVMPTWGVQPVFAQPWGMGGVPFSNSSFSQTTSIQQNSGVAPFVSTPSTTVVTGPNGGAAVVNQGFQVY